MSRYIGLDAHATSCTLAVVGKSGRQLGSQVVETNGAALLEAIKAIPRPRYLCIEEGTPSAWLYEVLSPVVDEMVVTQQARKSAGNKNDKLDAFGLATALCKGTLPRRIYKAPQRFAELRALAHTYNKIAWDVARTRNRLKSLYMSRGVHAIGKSVYGTAQRDEWLSQLPTTYRSAASLLYAELDQMVELKADAREQLVKESHRHDISHVLETCPGLGEVRVAQIISTVITPHRFRTARQYWSYCGFSIVMRSSSDWVKGSRGFERKAVLSTRGLSRQFNRVLKEVYKSAVISVLKDTTHPLTLHYERLLAAGTKPPNARLTVARKIAALSLAMWKNEERYDPARQTTHR
jgi:transposase